MRVLGVDPGLTRCGVGVVEGLPGRQLTMLGVGVVRTPPEDEIGPRLLAIEQGLESWLDRYQPELVAVERVFAQHNVRTVMGTAQASAVAVLCATRRGIPVTLHTPSEVKAAVTGSGRADKAQVTAMVTRLLRLDAPPKPADAADALALAICHIWRGGSTNRLTAAIKAHGAGGSSWHGGAPGRNQGRGEPREAGDAGQQDPPEQQAAPPRAAYGRVPGRSRSSPRP